MHIDKADRLNNLIYLHQVYAGNAAELTAAISKHPLKKISLKNASINVDSILWKQHKFNFYACKGEANPYEIRGFDSRADAKISLSHLQGVMWGGEDVECLFDETNGDVVVVNNFYSTPFIDDFPKQLVEGLRWLQTMAFPGTVVWRLITFPALTEFRAHGKMFHRGYCFCVTFRRSTPPVGVIDRPVERKFLKSQAKSSKRHPRPWSESEQKMVEYFKRRKIQSQDFE